MANQDAGFDAERRLIAGIEAVWPTRPAAGVALAGGDDCAIVRGAAAGEELLLTSDQVIENQHFKRGCHAPGALGRKALVRSLSDIAAMGGRPLYFLQALSLPGWALGGWHDAFQRGMREAAREFTEPEVALLGGDVARGDSFAATVTVIGVVERSTALRRCGARPGDRLYVSGSLGGSALGLRLLLGGTDPAADHPAVLRHSSPRPRLELGRALRRLRATAAIDLSDGLAIDANRLAAASGVALALDAESVPRFPGCSLEDALRSGEEYELLCAIPSGTEPPPGQPLTLIGRVESGSGVWLQSPSARRSLEPEGFAHF